MHIGSNNMEYADDVMIVKSRAAVARAIASPGIIIRVINHWQSQLVGTVRHPKVTRANGAPGIQTNGYYFDAPDATGKIVEMWSEIPGTKFIRFNDDNTVTFYPDTTRSVTVRFEKPL